MTFDQICISPPPPKPEDKHQCCNVSQRSYYVDRASGKAILHPVHNFTTIRGSGKLVSIHVYSTDTPTCNKMQEVPAKVLKRGDLIATPWPPSQDRERMPLDSWEYSPLAVQEIERNTFT